MEFIAIREDSNKENVSPVTTEESKAVPANVQSSKKIGERMLNRRKPLADITNLFHTPFQHTNDLSAFQFDSVSVQREKTVAAVSDSAN